MKIRTMMLAVLGLVILAGSVVPAQAEYRHHRHHHHHHHG
jgi:hypothetical protein